MRTIWQDLRYSARLLLKHPGFTLSAVAVLTLGIGVNAGVFGIINGLMIRPLAGADAPGELVGVFSKDRTATRDYRPFSYPGFSDVRDAGGPFAHLAGHTVALAGVTERLKPGVTRDQANAQLKVIAAAHEQAYPDDNKNQALVVGTLDRLDISTRPQDDTQIWMPLGILQGLAATVLLTSCMNLANMMLAFGSVRQKEIAIRLAIGGTRLRIVHQLLVQGLMLSLAGGALGLLTATWAAQWLMSSMATVFPIFLALDLTPDTTVLVAAPGRSREPRDHRRRTHDWAGPRHAARLGLAGRDLSDQPARSGDSGRRHRDSRDRVARGVNHSGPTGCTRSPDDCAQKRLTHSLCCVELSIGSNVPPAAGLLRNAAGEWQRISAYLWTSQRSPGIFFAMSKGKTTRTKKSEVLQGTLDLMILKTLQAMGPLHGFGIARRLEQLSEDVLSLNEGTVYTSLLRLQQEGWIAAEWGASENNRKAKFYSITKSGLKQLAKETEDWERISGVIGRVLRLEGQRS